NPAITRLLGKPRSKVHLAGASSWNISTRTKLAGPASEEAPRISPLVRPGVARLDPPVKTDAGAAEASVRHQPGLLVWAAMCSALRSSSSSARLQTIQLSPDIRELVRPGASSLRVGC